jgi:hypothetical protein
MEQLKRITMGTISRDQSADSPRRQKATTGATASGVATAGVPPSQTETRSPDMKIASATRQAIATPTAGPRRQYLSNPETPDLLHSDALSPETIKDLFDPSGKFEERSSGFPNRSRIATPKVTPHRVTAELTGRFSSNIVNSVVKGSSLSLSLSVSLCLSLSVSLSLSLSLS